MISKCPKCLQPVSRPLDVESAAEVICPLCNARFPLADTLDEIPPALVPAATPEIAVEDAVEKETDDIAEDTAADDDTDDGWRPPVPEPIDPSTMPAFMSAMETGRQKLENASHEAAFDFRPAGSEEQPEESAADVADRLRRSAGKKSIVREMIGIIFGGIAGLAVAYYALNFFGGPRFDILSVYLPGCPHTYRHWPDTRLQDWLGNDEPASNNNGD